VRPLPPDRLDSDGTQPSDLRDVPAETSQVVPNRLGPAGHSIPDLPPADLHVALIIDSIDHWSDIRKSAYIISPPYWAGNVQLHVILRNPKATPEEMLYKVALTQLGLVDPKIAGLTPDTQIDLGWPTTPPSSSEESL
jgi:hypothetical protein